MTDSEKMREVWEAHDKARNKAWREDPGTFDTLDAFKAGAAWQAAKSVPDAELERLRKDAERYRWLRSPNVGPATVYNVCMERIEGGLSTLKSDSLLDEAIDAAIAAEGEKE